MGIIYKAENYYTGECYIGQTKKSLNHRKFDHEYEAFTRKLKDKFHSALREFGRKAFVWSILAEHENYEELSKLEKSFIKKYKTISQGYNSQIRNDAKAVTRINDRNYRNNFHKDKLDAELEKYRIVQN